jgi:hypothetical protein
MPYFYPALPAARSHNFFTAADGQAVNDPSVPKYLPQAAPCTNDAAGHVCVAAKPIADFDI